ncbi:MAG TPA: sugar ABC transporter substrate-binding protein [Mycobacteriales bacterium]|nr:sugar ABC transporter substrate-binding protein [Mycobacteriales bacterium]
MRLRGPAACVPVAAALAFATAACGSSAPSGPPVSSPQFGVNATGVVHFWDRSATSPYGQLLVKEFNASHRNLKVELSPVQDTQYVTKLATAIRSGSAPDVVGVDDINSQLFIYNKAFLDLTSAVNKLPEKDKLSPGHLNLTTENGHYYGTPYVGDLSMLWYNKTLFKKAGLDPNEPPRNFADILNDARAVTKLGHGTYGFSFAGRCEGCLGFTMMPDVWATKTDVFAGQPGTQRATVSSNKALRRTLALYHQLWAEHLAAPESQTETGATWGQDFLAGKIGILPGGYGTVMASAPPSFQKQIGAVALPGPDGGSSTFDGGANFGIPKNAKNASGAWEFIRFALQKKQQAQAPTTGFEPIRTDVATPAYKAKYPFNAVVLDALPRGFAPKTIAYNVTFNQPGGPWLTMFIQSVFDGNIDGAIRKGQSGFADALGQAQS